MAGVTGERGTVQNAVSLGVAGGQEQEVGRNGLARVHPDHGAHLEVLVPGQLEHDGLHVPATDQSLVVRPDLSAPSEHLHQVDTQADEQFHDQRAEEREGQGLFLLAYLVDEQEDDEEVEVVDGGQVFPE